MFIPRMWSDEVERIGKQRCTPIGYELHGIGELVGFVGLLTLVAVPVYFVYRGLSGTFRWPLLWLLVIPFAIAILGSIVVAYSWSMAYRKQFRYDYERRVATWLEDGHERTLTFADLQVEKGSRTGW